MSGKQIIKDREVNKALSQSQGKLLTSRTRLHTRDIVLWLRRRFQFSNPNMNYLYFPEEIQKHREVEKIFRKFDEDESGRLTLGEFFNMLRDTGFNIDIDNLREFYQQVDDDHDIALDFTEFKNCTLSEEANYYFSNMMRKVREAYQPPSRETPVENEKKNIGPSIILPDEKLPDPKERKPFFPTTFGNLLNYVTYANQKKELLDFINNEGIRKSERFGKFRELFDLKMGKDVYLAKFYERFQNILEKNVQNQRYSYSTSKSMLPDLSPVESKAQLLKKKEQEEEKRNSQEMQELLKEIEALRKQAKENGQKEFQESKMKMKKQSTRQISTALPSETLSSTPRSQRKFGLNSEISPSQFKKIPRSPKTSGGIPQVLPDLHEDLGYRVVKLPSFNRTKYTLPESVGRLDTSSLQKVPGHVNTAVGSEQAIKPSSNSDLHVVDSQKVVHTEEAAVTSQRRPVRIISVPFQNSSKDRARTEDEPYQLRRIPRPNISEVKKNLPELELNFDDHDMSSLDTSRTNEKDAGKPKRVKVVGRIQTTKVSKMPSSYHNISPAFDRFLTNTFETQTSSRLTATPTDFVFSSASARRDTVEEAMKRKDSGMQSTAPGTFFRFPQSQSFSSRFHLNSAKEGKSSTRSSERIEVAGISIPHKVSKSNSVQSIGMEIRKMNKSSFKKVQV